MPRNLFRGGLDVAMANHKYVIRVDGKIVWEGLNVEEVFRKIKKENPEKEWHLLGYLQERRY